MQETATPARLSDLIRQHQRAILTRWQAEVRAMPDAHGISSAQLVDHVPTLLAEIADHVDGHDGAPVAERRHALERLDEGYDLGHVVGELVVLRDCVIEEALRTAGGLATFENLRALDHAIDDAIRAAVVRYTQARARVLEEARDTSERAATERRFLDEATRVLTSSLDYKETLENLADLAVPRIADWCVVHLVEGDEIRFVAVAHSDPAQLQLAHEWSRKYPVDPDASYGVAQVIRTGRAELATDIDETALLRIARSEEHARDIRRIGMRSGMIVPLAARGRTFGAVTMLSTTSERRYGEADLRIALELGARAGLAVDNARLYQEANRAIRIREDILAVVSHDLRNPLGAIDLAASMLMQNHGDEPRSRRQLDIIRRSADRMTGLISDLLDMASLQAGRLSFDKKPLAAASLLAEVLDSHEPLAAEKGIELVRDVSVGDARLLGDRDRLVQVFGNLIGNALKFCTPGDTITVRGRVEDHMIRFEVDDTGPGIPEADLPRIFEPYWSAQRHAKKGTGLGLYISKGIVEAHGGRLWVNSRGKGATFYLTIPRV